MEKGWIEFFYFNNRGEILNKMAMLKCFSTKLKLRIFQDNPL